MEVKRVRSFPFASCQTRFRRSDKVLFTLSHSGSGRMSSGGVDSSMANQMGLSSVSYFSPKPCCSFLGLYLALCDEGHESTAV